MFSDAKSSHLSSAIRSNLPWKANELVGLTRFDNENALKLGIFYKYINTRVQESLFTCGVCKSY
jgi:hypothetical protein